MTGSGPVMVLVIYKAKPGSEEELAGVLRTHVARLRELGLVADRPSFAAANPGEPGTYVESFWWASPAAPQQAHDHPDVQEIWMRISDLCVPDGVNHQHLVPLD